MRLRSLRQRFLAAAILAVSVSLLAVFLVLTHLFERHVTRHYDSELQSWLRQLAGVVEFLPDGKVELARPLPEARFGEPLSGLYWQIEEDETGMIVASRSLWDTHIPLPKDVLPLGQVDSHVLPGPQGSQLRIQERRIVFDLPSGSRSLRMAVAMDMAEITAARRAFAADLWPYLGAVGLLLLAGSWFTIGLGLAPLDRIRRSLNSVRTGAARRLDGEFPSEVMPLVAEANDLLAAQDDSLAQARARAADLAHGLKTPLAVLQSDAERLRARGHDDLADEMSQIASQMGRHVQRELARSRLRGEVTAPMRLLPVVERLVSSFRRTPGGERLDWVVQVPDTLFVAADAQDITELLGNLLDNAAKWARTAIRIEARSQGVTALVQVLDDGPGVPESALPSLAGRGVRLDESIPGHGLGLAIARDIAAACHGALQVSNRAGGGFAVIIELPTQQRSLAHA